MKKFFPIPLLLLVFSANAQLLSWTPDFIQESSTPVTIIMDANYGNQDLLNYGNTAVNDTNVYVHTGVITNLSNGQWAHVSSVWGSSGPAAAAFRATYLGNNKWSFTITGGLRSFYGLTNPNETILKIAILFRNGSGSLAQRNADGSDMFVPVYGSGLYARIDNPYRQPKFVPVPEPITKNIGDNLPIVAKASLASTINVYFNGSLISTATSATKDSTNTTIIDSGYQTIIAKDTLNSSSNSDTLSFYVYPANNVAAIPSGDHEGINYEAGDTSATLVLYAPLKKTIIVMGDFNNWTASSKYLMNVTPDGNYFWIRLTGLTPGTQYAYQYLIDNTLQLADYNSELVLDKDVDQSPIVKQNFPGLEAFPSQAAGTLATVLQTGQAPYMWNDGGFVKPDKRNLSIYELLVRDFVATESWNTLADTLNYLKKLGINAIEVMPFNNFEGASSWGYNSNFFFAPDKVYGTPTALKHFVDVCHQTGMAVIMDLAMADVSGSSPLVQMYFNSTTNTPTTQNPWLDSIPKISPSIIVGSQFNDSSQANITLRNRVYASWINNYHIDGFRFDLAGSYTSRQYPVNDPNYTWQSTYDTSRLNTWNNIYSSLQNIKPNTYCILESFVNQQEQIDYTNAGMMTWWVGDENGPFTQAAMGYNTNWDFSGGIYSYSGLSQPGLVTYAESHDEERVQYKNQAYGNSSGSYNVKDTATGLMRDAMVASFWAMIPGPKMMYEFEELGYGYSINTCSDGVTINNSCRTSPKPIRWDYLQNPNRLALHNIYSKLLNLKINPAYFSTFSTGSVNKNLSGAVKWMSVYSTALQVMVYGNFDVVQQTGTVSFPSTGTWYNFFTGADTTITSTSLTNVTLAPGQYAVYVNNASALAVSWLSFTANASADKSILNWSVNANSEVNGNYYAVERSADGINFNSIGTVAVLKTSNAVDHYTFTDAQPLSGTNYYRIKEVDKDGKFIYSGIASVTFSSAQNLWKVYPNPSVAGSNAALHLQSSFAKLTLQLSDASGKILFRYTTTNVAAGTVINIPSSGLAKGLYLLKIDTDKAGNTEKIIVY